MCVADVLVWASGRAVSQAMPLAVGRTKFEPCRRRCVVAVFGGWKYCEPWSLSVLAVTFSIRARRRGSGVTMRFHLLACRWHCGEWFAW